MLYAIEQGPVEKKILEMAIREGRPIPDAIANAPDLRKGLELYYVAYTELMTSRALGFGVQGPIPWMAIDAWSQDAELDEQQRSDLIYFCTCMDQAFLNRQAEKQRTSQPDGKSGGVRPTHA